MALYVESETLFISFKMVAERSTLSKKKKCLGKRKKFSTPSFLVHFIFQQERIFSAFCSKDWKTSFFLTLKKKHLKEPLPLYPLYPQRIKRKKCSNTFLKCSPTLWALILIKCSPFAYRWNDNCFHFLVWLVIFLNLKKVYSLGNVVSLCHYLNGSFFPFMSVQEFFDFPFSQVN